MKKTNAMRILEAKKIAFSVQEYDDNTEHELSHGAAGKTAEKLGISPECVFKTIVMRTDTERTYRSRQYVSDSSRYIR